MVLIRLVLPAMKNFTRRLVALGYFIFTMHTLAADVPDSVNIAKAREHGNQQLFQWVPWTDDNFARAKQERRFILLDCAAEWCHWCHVMEATTYHDPEVQKALADKFIAVKVDIDRQIAGMLGVTADQIGRSLTDATSSSRFTVPNFWPDPRSGVGYQVQVEVPAPRMN